MNILWITLCACMMILVSVDWSLQSMSRDNQIAKIHQNYQKILTNQNFEIQKQYYGQLKREWTQLGATSQTHKEPPGDAIESKKEVNETGEPKEVGLYRFSTYPLNARLPLSFKSFQKENSKSVYFREAWWNLLDALYGSEEFYRSWRSGLDQDAFFEELLAGLETLSKNWAGTGSWGLLQITFQSPFDQRVWAQMIKGSDRKGSKYPSLLVYVWAADLGPGFRSVQPKLNLPTASFEIIQAMLGEGFANEWKSEVETKIMSLMEEADYRGSLNDKWILDQASYKEILAKVKKSANVPVDHVESLVDLTVGKWRLMHEYLIKGEGLGSGYLASTLELKRKKSS